MLRRFPLILLWVPGHDTSWALRREAEDHCIITNTDDHHPFEYNTSISVGVTPLSRLVPPSCLMRDGARVWLLQDSTAHTCRKQKQGNELFGHWCIGIVGEYTPPGLGLGGTGYCIFDIPAAVISSPHLSVHATTMLGATHLMITHNPHSSHAFHTFFRLFFFLFYGTLPYAAHNVGWMHNRTSWVTCASALESPEFTHVAPSSCISECALW